MTYFKVYIVLLQGILVCISSTWAEIDIPEIIRLKELPARREPWKKKLQCITKGNPKPTLSWTYNGKPIEPKGRYSVENNVLVIDRISSADSGSYRCYASNPLGMIFSQIEVKILGIGHFKEGFDADSIPLIQNVTIGEPVKIPCPNHTDEKGQTYAWALPPLDILHPGKPITNAFLSDSHGALYFSSITPEDIELINQKGVSCLLFIDFNNLEASVKISLRSDGEVSTDNYGPEMVVFFKNGTVGVEGEKVELRCGATGKPHPSFKWFKDGKAISSDDGTESTVDHIYISGNGLLLTINKLMKSDQGKYKCVASNSEGTVEDEATLLVHSKVALTKRLDRKLNIPVKQPVKMECAATGHPAPKFIWYHNNTIIESTDRRKISGGTLEIAQTDFGDCGMYLCTVGNYLNTLVTPTYLSIKDVPPTFTKKIDSSYFLFVGQHYKLTCDAVGGPEPTITWYQDDKEITVGDHFQLTADGKTLMLNNVQKAQNGVYKCVAENRKDKVEATGVVKAFVQTNIVRPPDDVKYPVGYNAYLFCDATYDLTLKDSMKLQWYKDGVALDLDNSDRVYLKDKDRIEKLDEMSNTLKVKSVVPGDGGVYKCVVTTNEGKFNIQDQASGSITVIAPPLAVGNVRLRGSFDKKKPTTAPSGGSGTGSAVTTTAPGGGSGSGGSGSGSATAAPGGSTTASTTPIPLKEGEVILEWDEPSKYVGPADKYIIQYAPAGTDKDSDDWTDYDPPNKYEGTNVKLDKDKLPPATDLIFRIKPIATNNDEELVGKPSEPTKAGSLVTPSAPPKLEPSNVKLAMKDKENSSITWDKPDKVDSDAPGFKTVGKYRQIKPTKDDDFTEFEKKGDGTSVDGPSAPDDGVDREYEVEIASENDAGKGPVKKFILKVPGKKPSKKVGNVVLVEVTDAGAKIKWDPVEGASGYRVYYTKKDSTSRRKRRNTKASMDVDSTTATVSDLSPGSEYEISVAVLNPKGEGPPSDPLDVATKNGGPDNSKQIPDIPKDVNLDTYADSVKLDWKPPKQPGIKNYTVSWYPEDDPSKKKTKTVPADELEAFITDPDMNPKKYYTVEVQANNDDGKGKPWKMEGVVIGAPDVPGKPAPPETKPINETKIEATFKLPDDYFGGLPKAFFICYEDTPKDKCVEGKYPENKTVVVDGLDHTKKYKFYSYATNDKGKGKRSEWSTETKPLDPPTTIPPTTTTLPTNKTVVVERSTAEDQAFYEELWFIILLIILLILIIILIILCIICNRRGGRYPVGKKEKDYGGWDKDPLKAYSENAMENGGADLPLITPSQSPDRDSIKKVPFDDDLDDEDSLADYGEGYGDMGQYGTDNKKEKNGQTLC